MGCAETVRFEVEGADQKYWQLAPTVVLGFSVPLLEVGMSFEINEDHLQIYYRCTIYLQLGFGVPREELISKLRCSIAYGQGDIVRARKISSQLVDQTFLKCRQHVEKVRVRSTEIRVLVIVRGRCRKG